MSRAPRRLGVADAQTSIRLPQDQLDRADALIKPLFATTPAFGGLVRGWGRSDVLRIAIERGLQSLEKDCGLDAESPTSSSP